MARMARILADLYFALSVLFRPIRPIRVQEMLNCFPWLSATDGADETNSRGF